MRPVTVICIGCAVLAFVMGEYLATLWAAVAAFAFEEPQQTRRK